MKMIQPKVSTGKVPRRIGNLIVSVCVAAATLLTAATTQASLLVYEGFNGYTAGTLNGQSVSANVQGLTGTYTSSNWNYNATGLTFGDLQVSGGSSNATGSDPGSLRVSLSSSAATTGTLWGSYLVKLSSTTGNVGLGVYDPGAATIHFNAAPVEGTATLHNTYNASGWAAGSANNTTTGTTFLVLSVWTNVGSALSSGTVGTAYSYMLTASQYTWFENNGGLTQAALNAATVGTADGNVFNRVSASANSGGPFLFDDTQSLRLFAQYNYNSAVFDEIRYGTALGDVIVVPEPSTLALMLVAGIAGAATRRRRQAA